MQKRFLQKLLEILSQDSGRNIFLLGHFRHPHTLLNSVSTRNHQKLIRSISARETKLGDKIIPLSINSFCESSSYLASGELNLDHFYHLFLLNGAQSNLSHFCFWDPPWELKSIVLSCDINFLSSSSLSQERNLQITVLFLALWVT